MRETNIDDQRLDVSQDTPPAIVFNNPIFYDLSNMKANRTTTYKIPLSTENIKKLGNIGILDAVTTFPQSIHRLEELRDGLPIIRNAQAKLLQVSPDEAQFSVSWGVLKPVAEILKINLTELTPVPPVMWDENTEYIPRGEMPDYGFLYLRTFPNAETTEDFDKQYKFPSVNVRWLMEKIGADTGINFVFPQAVRDELHTWYVPLLTKKAGVDTSDPNAASFGEFYQRTTFSTYWTVDRDPFGVFVPFTGSGTPIVPISNMRLPVGSYTMRIRFSVSNLPAYIPYNNMSVNVGVFDRSQINNYNRTYNTERLSFIDEVADFEIDVSESDGVGDGRAAVNLSFFGNGNLLGNTIAGIPQHGVQSIRVAATVWASSGDIVFGTPFPIVPNLPRMSALDFIKSIMFLNGLYVRPGDNESITFDFIDNILETYDRSEDLEERLLTRKAKTLKYTYGDYAQVNTLSYAEDDTVRTNANGSIEINNSTLAATREMVKVNFAPSDNFRLSLNTDLAIVPIYAVNEDDPTVFDYQGESLTPRIVKYTTNNVEISARGVFNTDQYFGTIINERYKLLTRVLTNPRVVQFDVYTNTLQLYQLDETRIFYFRGAYWLLIQGTVTGNILSGDFINIPISDTQVTT